MTVRTETSTRAPALFVMLNPSTVDGKTGGSDDNRPRS